MSQSVLGSMTFVKNGDMRFVIWAQVKNITKGHFRKQDFSGYTHQQIMNNMGGTRQTSWTVWMS